MIPGFVFNPPPNWPIEPGWVPPDGWVPDPIWPAAPSDWEFWIEDPGAEVQLVSLADAATPDLSRVADSDTTSAPSPMRATSDSRPEPSATAQPLSPSSDGQASKAGEQNERYLQDIRTEVERELRAQLVELNDALTLQAAGVYEYHHPLESAAAYKEELDSIQSRIKQAITGDRAILASSTFSLDNSLAKGKRMVSDLGKLMLRAYNAEADNAVRTLRAGALATALRRLDSSADAIARLGQMMDMRISQEYHDLRIEELKLTADYLAKIAKERERAREERERLREEAKAEREIALERERLEKERSHYDNALKSMLEQGKEAEASELRERLEEIGKAIEFNDYRAANIRAGYVYVISNIGAFGPDVVKIGLTRRLDPMDRIRELGDASVPFPFDVHALFFADDAVGLEAQLHQAFVERKMNQVNQRREFFFASPAQVREALLESAGSLLEFQEIPEATEYHQSRAMWPNSASADIATPGTV